MEQYAFAEGAGPHRGVLIAGAHGGDPGFDGTGVDGIAEERLHDLLLLGAYILLRALWSGLGG